MPNNRWTKPNPVSLGLLISGLRSKPDRRSGQLVVQTGFPTSLADLVVKNQSRLKKNKQKKKIKSKENNPSFSTSSELLQLVDEVEVKSKCSKSVAAVVVRQEEGNNSAIRIGIFVLVLLVALVVIAGKGLVIGVMSSAFALIVCEGFGIRVLEVLNLDKFGRRGKNIEIEENGVLEDCLISSVPLQLDQDNEILVESRDFDVISAVSDENRSKFGDFIGQVSENDKKNKKKKKKFFQKIFRKKSRRSNDEENKMSSNSEYGINGSEVDNMMITKIGLDEPNVHEKVSVISAEELQTIQELAIESSSNNVNIVDEIQGNLDDKKLRSMRQLFFFFLVILLSVLWGGKLAALLITSFSYVLMKVVQKISQNQILKR